MHVVGLDLEGVLIPEIWIEVADRTGISDLRATTRDVPDYDELMRFRLDLLEKHDLRLPDIQSVIATLSPLDGAKAFLDGLRDTRQVAILSDTYYEFAHPMMVKLGMPSLYCHRLEVDADGRVGGYRLRQVDPKRRAVEAFQSLCYPVLAAGDSYNDTSMLAAADCGYLFRAPPNVISEFPQFAHTDSYDSLRSMFDAAVTELDPH